MVEQPPGHAIRLVNWPFPRVNWEIAGSRIRAAAIGRQPDPMPPGARRRSPPSWRLRGSRVRAPARGAGFTARWPPCRRAARRSRERCRGDEERAPVQERRAPPRRGASRRQREVVEVPPPPRLNARWAPDERNRPTQTDVELDSVFANQFLTLGPRIRTAPRRNDSVARLDKASRRGCGLSADRSPSLRCTGRSPGR